MPSVVYSTFKTWILIIIVIKKPSLKNMSLEENKYFASFSKQLTLIFYQFLKHIVIWC